MRAIFGWANERYSDHWPGLFAIGFIVAIIPLTRIALEQGDPNALHPGVRIGLFLGYELVLLLGTAAMVLLATSPEDARASEAWRDVLRDWPRLILVKIATALVRWLPAIAAGALIRGIGPGAGIIVLLAAALMLPFGFVSQMAFASAVIERTGPFAAIERAFRRAIYGGLWTLWVAAFLFSLVESLPVVFVWVANIFFPPSMVPYTLPRVPGFGFPLPPMSLPGPFGSGIPWWMIMMLRLATIPVLGYVAALYAGAALEFAGADTSTREKPDVFASYT